MSKIPPITPGRITALWRVLKTVAKYNNISEFDLLNIASNTSLRGGGLPIADGLSLAVVGGFVNIEEERINIISFGKKIVKMWDKEEPSSFVIRYLLLYLVLELKPAWVIFAAKPPKERIIAIPGVWREVLENAELLDAPLGREAVKWWTTLQRKVDELEKKIIKKIGDAGENLTIRYEKERLLTDQYFKLAEMIKWVSKESDNPGYDIASFFGSLQPSRKEEMMMIEVKSTTSDSSKTFRFYLTRNEWETALNNTKNYFFYLWRGIKISKQNVMGDGPIILPVKIISKYVPLDIHEQGKWTKCRIELDLEEMKICKIN